MPVAPKIFYPIGALVLLAALIGAVSYDRRRDRANDRVTERATRDSTRTPSTIPSSERR